MKAKFPIWVLISIVLTATFSILSTIPRIKVEESNKAVGLALEFQSVKEVAALTATVPDTLAKLKASGINGLVLSEQAGSDLINEGLVQIQTLNPGRIQVNGQETAITRLAEAIDAVRPEALEEPYFGGSTITLKMDAAVFRGISVGIDPDEVLLANENDLFIVARYANRGNQANWLINKAKSQGIKYFLPLGDSVLGFQDQLESVIDSLKTNQILYVSPEFSNMVGDSAVRAKSNENVVRLHTAQTAELSRMDLPAIVERYAKAFKERNNRILLVRPQYSGGTTEQLSTLVTAIKSAVIADGGGIKEPRPFQDFEANPLLCLLVGLAMIPTLYWTLRNLLPSASSMTLWLPSAIIGMAALPEPTRKITALLASIAFPIAAYQWLLENRERHLLVQFIAVSAISLVGGLQVPALLMGGAYMLQAGQFLGVKASVFLPILVVAIILLNEIKPLKDIAKEPILWGTAVASILGLAALMFMNSRTGNDNPSGVSGTELAFRNILDRFLPVRPRTKEFMIGHPALILGLAFWHQKNPKHSALASVLLVVSVIGQTSIVNTMCHLHTPLLLSLLRVFVGLLAGGMIGGVLWVIARFFMQKNQRTTIKSGGKS